MTGLAGLGLFLVGILLLEEGLKALVGRPFKLLLRRYTERPVQAIAVGAITTAILQSSTVVTLLLLALVGSGVLGIRHAVGIVLGANLGTTVTGWLVALLGFGGGVDGLAVPLVAVGSILWVSTEGAWAKASNWGRAILGFGLVLLGLGMVKAATAGLADHVDLTRYAAYGALPFALAGLLLAAVMHSSAAVMVITLAALHAGVIELHSAAAVVLGADLGTTSTVVIGGWRGSAVNRRVALAHFLFNLTTDLVGLLLLPLVVAALLWGFGPDQPLLVLVAFHSAVNVIGIALFFPFLDRFTALLERSFSHATELPPGFEGLVTLDTRLPMAALLVVERAVRALLAAALDLNRMAVGLHEAPEDLRTRLLGERDYLERYVAFKQLEGHVLAAAGKVQSARLDPSQATALGLLLAAVRDAGQGVKALRDVERNLREFEGSPDPALFGRFERIRSRQVGLYDALGALLLGTAEGQDATREPTGLDRAAFERLSDLLADNRAAYLAGIEAVHREAPTGAVPADRVADALNVGSELHASNTRTILAFGGLLLPEALLAAFERLPER